MGQIADKTRYSDKELEEFKVLLQEKLGKAKKQLDFYLSHLSDNGDNPDSKVKGFDDAIGTTENERMTQMAARQNKHIKHLENALLRVENKVYGICRVTGKLISKERLKAVPHATLSMEAKMKR